MYEGLHFEYKGFEYRTWLDDDGDVIKMFHECYKDGKQVKMSNAFYNHSPYRLVPEEAFARFVDEVLFVEFIRG